MHQHTFTWQGREIAWSRSGAGPAVVLLHGTPFSASVWDPYVAELSVRHTVFTWDLPGYGESSMEPQHRVDFGVHSAVFVALLEHWGVERPHVVAHDFGAGVAVRAHLVEDVDYASLLLLDGVVVPPVGSPFFRFVGEHPDVLIDVPGFIHRGIVSSYVAGASARGLGAEELEALVAPWTGDRGQPAFYRQIAEYDEAFLAENERLLEGVRTPVRVLWGGRDEWLGVDLGRALCAKIPGAEWREIEGAGHLVQHDAPVALSHELTEWLARQAG